VLYSNELTPIDLTLVGTVADVIEQYRKALSLIDVMEVEMTMSPLQHKPPCEVLSTQPVVVTSSDILLLIEATATATATADAGTFSCWVFFVLPITISKLIAELVATGNATPPCWSKFFFFFCPTILLCLSFCSEDEKEEDAETGIDTKKK